MIIPVVLSGGSGTRLWPLSSPEKPKQFLPLATRNTLFQDTILRLEGLPELTRPIIVCNQLHGSLVAEQLTTIGTQALSIVLEPEGRNTAPAIAIAAMLAGGPGRDSDAAGDQVLLVLPADHVIVDVAAFQAAVSRAVKVARVGKLITLGIVPTRAETGYGYIEQGVDQGDYAAVDRFVEKPDIEAAKRYQASGRYLWNSGIFVFRPSTVLAEIERHAPGIHAACTRAEKESVVDGAFTRLGAAFLRSPSDSIDYAVMEKTDKAAVIPLDAGWSDVGSWAALQEIAEHDEHGNVLRGDVIAENSENAYIWSSGRTVAVLGLKDIVVVETDEAVLVMARDRAQEVKRFAEAFRPARPGGPGSEES